MRNGRVLIPEFSAALDLLERGIRDYREQTTYLDESSISKSSQHLLEALLNAVKWTHQEGQAWANLAGQREGLTRTGTVATRRGQKQQR